MTDNTLQELLPCPFCGSENILEFGKQDDDWASVECRNCRAGTHKFENLQDAVAAWNTRASLGKGEAKPVEVGELANTIEEDTQIITSPTDWMPLPEPPKRARE